MTNPFSLEGKTVLVTGASSGIGRAVALACAGMGASVIVNGRNRERLESVLAQLEGNGHSLIAGDLTLSGDVERISDSVPSLDGVVHCAGIGHRNMCKFLESEEIDSVMNTNFKSAVSLQTALQTAKKLRKGGSIVFMASRAATTPSIGNAVYSAAKGAMISYSKCLGLELAPQRIRVNCICPAMVWTDLILQGGVDKETLAEEEKKYPLGRYGKPEDIAWLAVYLLSDASGWMTNSCIDITGGSLTL